MNQYAIIEPILYHLCKRVKVNHSRLCPDRKETEISLLRLLLFEIRGYIEDPRPGALVDPARVWDEIDQIVEVRKREPFFDWRRLVKDVLFRDFGLS